MYSNLVTRLFWTSRIRLVQAWSQILFSLEGVEFGKGIAIFGMPIVDRYPNSVMRLGHRVVLISWSRYTALGVKHPVIFRTLTDSAELIIGNDVGISGGAFCAARYLSIGDHCLIGADVIITDTDFHPLSPQNRRYAGMQDALTEEVIIGDNVFIGTGSMVLKGVHIGDNSVIGAGSIVTHDIPDNVIASGNPCRVLRGL